MSTREIDSFRFLEPFDPEPSEEAPEAPDPEVPEAPKKVEGAEGAEGPNTPDEPENKEIIKVNPADVPMEVVKPQGDGVQMDLFGGDL